MKEAIEIYKTLFEPSDVLDEPYVIVCLNTIVAENDDEAQYSASSMAQVMVRYHSWQNAARSTANT